MTSWFNSKKATIENCEFEFECPKKWANLDETNVKSVRYCSSCNRNVFLSVTTEQFTSKALKGRFVAIPIINPPSTFDNRGNGNFSVGTGKFTLLS